MEKLRSYLTGQRKGEFAKAISVPPSYLSQLLSGNRTPGLEIACRIEVATNGAVSVHDWVKRDTAQTAAE
jgi:DNA-binding transcriptional regulator YdaS (Cro superfamily)